ncbi:MAG: SDR family oxidoreductase [Anaerolineae bacterium]|nr:SDR family oxidoreductase [Anaerolineae bacterium]
MGMLDGKVAVITGSSRGLGLAIARRYASEGATVVLSARSAGRVEEAVNALKAEGLRAGSLAADVGKREQVEALAQYALTTFGRIDIWVNNAGIPGIYGPTAHIPNSNFESVLNTNILGVHYGSLTALRHFVPQKRGKLINLLGRGDTGPVANQNAYGASKIWVKSYTLALAKEYKDSGVGVFAFNPGLVDTDLLRQIEAIEGYEAGLKPLRTVIRLWANPPEVPAEKALWLASSATDGKTGLNVNVLGRAQAIAGLARDIGRRLRGVPGPDTTLTITTIPSEMP